MAQKISSEPLTDAIAVIGMACRVPGAHSVREFWQLLLDSVDAIDAPPQGRPGAPLRARGGYLDDVHQFDADFFGISPREALAMDPQQRLLLENCWEALEDAGIAPHRLAGSRTGVFVGTSDSHYWDLQVRRGDPDIYAMTGGGARSTTSGRLSYALDLRGPSMSIDTACSSSLVAVALACRSLAAGESTTALAGGVHLVLAPTETEVFADAGMLAPDGRCKFGDASADGFVRGEAVGTVVLKRLDQALADGDPVRAVIRGWATSSDGAASGSLMAPAVAGQRDVLRAAYASSGVDPADVDYVEAHGTGTAVGDPVELEALSQVLGPGRGAERRLPVGSVKTNIGHTEAAAGVVGLIKATLVLQHRVIPPSLHMHTPTPAVDWATAPVRLIRHTEPLDVIGRPAHVGVSAFGISGTNAHLVLAEAPPSDHVPHPQDAAQTEVADEHLLSMSARTPDALLDLVRGYLTYLGPGGPGRELDLADICHTAATRRTPHEHRLGVVGRDHESLAAALRSALHDKPSPITARPHRVAFVFPGQGSQWIGMGRELLITSPAFRFALHRCGEAIKAETGWSVLDVLNTDTDAGADGADAGPGVWGQPEIVQPTIWAMQVALAETWQAWGLHPDVVVGHSMGEVAAAHLAGVLSLRDAAAVICRRSRLVTRAAAGQGGMAVAELPAAEVEGLITRFGGRLSVAAKNGPSTTVVAGDVDALEELRTEMEERDVFCRLVRVDFASHSAQMDPLLPALAEELAELTPMAPTTAMRSTVTGKLIAGGELDANYWTRNLREPVRFAEVIAQLAAEEPTAFIEISPHPVLTTAVADTIAAVGADSPVIGSLLRNRPERETLLGALGTLWAAGVDVDGNARLFTGRSVPLPRYPWQREPFWFDGHTEDPDPAVVVRESVLDPVVDPYLTHHVVDGIHLMGGPVLLEAAREAAAEIFGADLTMTDISFTEALIIDPVRSLALRVELTPTGDGSASFTIRSNSDEPGGWTTHCTGAVSTNVPTSPEPETAQTVATRCTDYWSAEEFYVFAATGGTRSGPSMQAVQDLWRGPGEALARLQRPAALTGAQGSPVHPALLEAAALPLLAALGAPGSILAAGIGRFEVYQPIATDELWSHVCVGGRDGEMLLADVVVTDGASTPVARISGLRIHQMPQVANRTTATERNENRMTETIATENASPAPFTVRWSTELQMSRPDESVEVHTTVRLGATTAAQRTHPPAPLIALPAAPRASTPSVPPTRAAFSPSLPTASPNEPPAADTHRVNSAPAAPIRTPPQTSTMPAATAAPAVAGDTEQMIVQQIAEVLRMPASNVRVDRPLRDLGLDSLMALEIRKRLQTRCQLAIPTKTILSGATAGDLALLVNKPVTADTHP